jgi:hypothetical protein
LEQALQDAGRPHATVMTDVETPYIEQDKVMVYKLHGCVSRPASLILTAKDECLLEKRLVAYLSVLRYLFVTKSLLFLDYSLDGRLFETLFNEVTANVEEHRRRAYAVWPAPAQTWREIWAKDGLTLLDQEAGDFLDALARQVSRRERALATETRPAPLDKPPYKFLDFYESADRDIFYGRQIESVRFFRLILSHRLTVLFGASGTGKTSLLKAGVMPLLWEQGYATVYVRALDDPLAAVRSEVLALLRQRGRAVADPGARTLQNFSAPRSTPTTGWWSSSTSSRSSSCGWPTPCGGVFGPNWSPSETFPLSRRERGIEGVRFASSSACGRTSWRRSTRPGSRSLSCWAIPTGW